MRDLLERQAIRHQDVVQFADVVEEGREAGDSVLAELERENAAVYLRRRLLVEGIAVNGDAIRRVLKQHFGIER